MIKKRLLTLLSLSCAAIVALAQPSAAPLRLTLDQCVRIALDENPTVKVDSLEIERVNYALKEIQGQLLPAVNMNAQYTRNLALQTMYMDAGDGTTRAIKMGTDNNYSGGFSASIPIVVPTLWRSIKLSENQILQNIEKARADRLQLVNQVKNAYYALLLAQDSYRVIERNHSTAQQHAEIYQQQFKLGTASEYDVLRANVAVTNLEPSMLEAENSIDILMLQLKVLMGMDVRTEIAPSQTLDDFKSTMYDHVMTTDTSLVNNTSLKSLDLQTDYLRQVVRVQRASWLPTVTGSASLMWHSMSNGNPLDNFRWNRSSALGLTVAFPVFQGFQRQNKIRQAEISVREMGWQRENLERSLHMQVQSQVDNINKALRQIEANDAGVKQALKASDIIHQSFQIGAASFIQVRDTDDALMNAQLSYYQAIYQYLVADNDLELVLGNTPYVR